MEDNPKPNFMFKSIHKFKNVFQKDQDESTSSSALHQGNIEYSSMP